MKILLAGAALLAALMTPAAAETRYDVMLERAVMEIVAGRMGDLRGSLPSAASRNSSCFRMIPPATTVFWKPREPNSGAALPMAGCR
ncbi:hypothetical protein [Mesorhizobium sp. KR2-14]|uniref:hypothetical protein n=1 Tax=Mesorhizobium sp. KR2-14 TaxID=3156610 RepID=UPI0032B397C7